MRSATGQHVLDECLHNRWACWGWQVQPAWKLRPNTTAGRSPVRHPVDRSGGIGSSRFEFGGRRQKVVGASPRRSPFCAYAAHPSWIAQHSEAQRPADRRHVSATCRPPQAARRTGRPSAVAGPLLLALTVWGGLWQFDALKRRAPASAPPPAAAAVAAAARYSGASLNGQSSGS